MELDGVWWVVRGEGGKGKLDGVGGEGGNEVTTSGWREGWSFWYELEGLGSGLFGWRFG